MNFYEEYEAPEPERPEAHGMRRFFQIIGQNCDTILKLNLLFLLSCIPVITIPPALYALHRLSRRMVKNQVVRCWSQYWEIFRKEWKQAYLAFLLTALPLTAAGYGAWFYLRNTAANVLLYLPFVFCAIVFLTALLGSGYLYALLADERKLSKETVVLSLKLGLGKPLRSVLAAVSWYGLLAVSVLWFPVSGIYLLMLGFSIPSLLWQFFVRTVLAKFT